MPEAFDIAETLDLQIGQLDILGKKEKIILRIVESIFKNLGFLNIVN